MTFDPVATVVAVKTKLEAAPVAEIVDAFGQRSRLDFSQVVANPTLPADTFVFTVPRGADVLQQ